MICKNCPHSKAQHDHQGKCKAKVGTSFLDVRYGKCKCKGWQTRGVFDKKPNPRGQ